MSRTIAAIATAFGEGALAVIRISGEDALKVCDKIFRSVSRKRVTDAAGYSALYGHIFDLSGEPIDEAVVTVFKAPKSYTGENVAEISVHGGRISAELTLRAAFAAGAMAAEAGEFTRQAFMNGKMNLAEAEAVLGLINASSSYDLRLQLNARGGKISKAVAEIRDELISAAGDISAYSDFPDEDLPGLDIPSISAKIRAAAEKVRRLVDSFDAGEVLHSGVNTAIVGSPNAGKSSLMNLLCKNERSIVTAVPGTTRDVIEQTVLCGSVPLHLFDTAGIRATEDIVEAAGIERTRDCLNTAQLVLAVFDGSKELSDDDKILLEELNPDNTIIVINKSDLGVVDTSAFGGFDSVVISAKTAEGEEELIKAILDKTGAARILPDTAVLSTARQQACALRALASLGEAVSALEMGLTLDAAGVCLDDALEAMLSLTGERVTERVADDVFSRFCVGK